MISLGAGFNPELTGYENIVLYGTLLGRDPRDMRESADRIADWAGLAEFMDVPVRSYSSGMLARLGFSIASDIDPDVLVVDEVLAVGDEAFQRKSFDRMMAMMNSGTAVLLVTHQLDKVLEMADRVLWMDQWPRQDDRRPRRGRGVVSRVGRVGDRLPQLCSCVSQLAMWRFPHARTWAGEGALVRRASCTSSATDSGLVIRSHHV